MPTWLHRLDSRVPTRYGVWLACAALTLVFAISWVIKGMQTLDAVLMMGFAALTYRGVLDVRQTRIKELEARRQAFQKKVQHVPLSEPSGAGGG